MERERSGESFPIDLSHWALDLAIEAKYIASHQAAELIGHNLSFEEILNVLFEWIERRGGISADVLAPVLAYVEETQ